MGVAAGTPPPPPAPPAPAAHPVLEQLAFAPSPGGQVAAQPQLPFSWATPLAQMQQMPVGLAMRVPLVDSSPFPVWDQEGLDTCNIAEEAMRMMNAMIGGGAAEATNVTPPTSTGLVTPGLGGAMRPSPLAPGTVMPLTSMTSRARPGRGAGDPITPALHMASPGRVRLSPSVDSTLESQVEHLFSMLLAEKQRAEEAERQCAQLKDQIQTLSFSILQQEEDGAADMEKEARVYAEEKLREAQAQVVSLSDSLRAVQLNVAEGAEALATSQAFITSQAAQLKEQAAQASASAAEMHALRKQLLEVQGGQHFAQQAATAAHSRAEELHARCASLTAEAERCIKERDRAKEHHVKAAQLLTEEQLKARQQIIDAQRKVASLEGAANRMAAERDALKSRLTESQASEAEARKEQATAKANNGELYKMADQLMALVATEQKKNEKLTAALAKLGYTV